MSENKTLTKEDRLAFLLRKTIADFVDAEVKAERSDIFTDLINRYDEEGIKQLVVKLPDGEAIATLTIAQPKPKTTVKDSDKLLAWALEHRPELVEEIPAEKVVPTASVNALVKETTVIDGEHFTEAGEAIPGLRTSTPEPSSFTVRYAEGTKSQERLVEAWRAGDLANLPTGDTLPALDWTGRPQQQEGEAA